MPLDPSLLPASVRPWFVLPEMWRQSMATISAKAANRLEAVQYHLAGFPVYWVSWESGRAVVRLIDAPPLMLDCDFKRPADMDAVLDRAKAIAHELPREWAIRPLTEYPDWYRRHGFRIAYPLTCNVLYCPAGQWGGIPAIDLGAISA